MIYEFHKDKIIKGGGAIAVFSLFEWINGTKENNSAAITFCRLINYAKLEKNHIENFFLLYIVKTKFL